MKGCLRVVHCSICGHNLLIENGKRLNEPCYCMLERAAIQAESREAEKEAQKADQRADLRRKNA